MKIHEIMQPSVKTKARILKESWSNDTEQPFSENQLQVIAEDVIRAESSDNWQKFQTIEEFAHWMESLKKRYG